MSHPFIHREKLIQRKEISRIKLPIPKDWSVVCIIRFDGKEFLLLEWPWEIDNILPFRLHTMKENGSISDYELVRECLAGSEQAWNQFYLKYVGLVKNIVRRRLGYKYDVNDVSQSVFASLISALRTYDDAYSLQRFVSTVAERICIHEFRLTTAAKRRAETDAYEYSDEIVGAVASTDGNELQDEILAKKQQVLILRTGMQFLGERCRELLKLRYYEELSYKEISALLGGTENSLTVQVRRCLDELKGRCKKIVNKPRISGGAERSAAHGLFE